MGFFDGRETDKNQDIEEVLCLVKANRTPSEIICDIRDLIQTKTGAKKCELFLFDRRLNRYSAWAQEGPQGRGEGFHRHDPIILLVERERRILQASEWHNLPVPEGRPQSLAGLELLIPIFVGFDMVGIIGLGGLDEGRKNILNEKKNPLRDFLEISFVSLGLLIENAALRGLVIEDYTTGLRSHEYFNLRLTDEVERAIRYNRRVSLLMIKLGGLSKVLQQTSPVAAEKLLQRIGAILLENTRRMNLVARFATDPDIFQVMMPEIPGDAVRRQGEGLASRLAKILAEEGRRDLHILFGHATYPDNAPSRKLMTAKAFEELKRAEDMGQRQKVGPEKSALDEIPHYVRDLDIRSPEMISILETAHRIADSKSTILLQGETGVGKEVMAEFIHRYSSRKDNALVKVNCGALPENLVESELFGHEKGSFTGAEARRIGRFEQAHGGTIFLDEIGELTPLAQVKLLRIIEGKAFYRLGGTTPIATDVRVVAATNRDLLAEVQNGTFREDLFYRLNVVSFTIPPLRDRREDIPMLVTRFMQEFNQENDTKVELIHPEAMDVLYRYNWPGNVRELKNAVERAMILTGKIGTLISRYLPPSILRSIQGAEPGAPTSKKDKYDSSRPAVSAAPAEPSGYSLRFPDLNERQRQVIDYLRTNTSISNQEYVNMMRVSRRTCVRDLNGLIEKRLVVREGKKKSCVYRLAEGI